MVWMEIGLGFAQEKGKGEADPSLGAEYRRSGQLIINYQLETMAGAL